ncbi:Sec-independent protein translocase protein TatB [Paludibacterium paludis]|uniref:Sec-independent protein translocase protein TatB n=1 Tax=Paludibacterium paludis TaxID=1225769 RepID=A0A918UA71_9NEIS|nr:Sec-independent protein translocase protein TatB [Paludibacterium paludis]GGY15371.1 Sec-independent protein translocase protein TatB [Paludibacterium paludis]
MFDISFGELLLIGGVALVVLGPERLPEVARTLGALVGRAQRFVASVKADIGQEARLDELALLRQDVEATARHFSAQLESEVRSAREAVEVFPAEEPPAPQIGSAAPVRDENQLDLFEELPPPREDAPPISTDPTHR